MILDNLNEQFPGLTAEELERLGEEITASHPGFKGAEATVLPGVAAPASADLSALHRKIDSLNRPLVATDPRLLAAVADLRTAVDKLTALYAALPDRNSAEMEQRILERLTEIREGLAATGREKPEAVIVEKQVVAPEVLTAIADVKAAVEAITLPTPLPHECRVPEVIVKEVSVDRVTERVKEVPVERIVVQSTPVPADRWKTPFRLVVLVLLAVLAALSARGQDPAQSGDPSSRPNYWLYRSGSLVPTPNAPLLFTDISTPANPAAGKTKVYTKGGQPCALSPAGVETCLSAAPSGGAVGGASSLTTTGAVPFVTSSGSLGQNSLFCFDSVNVRQGIGTCTPAVKLDVVGDIRTSNVLYAAGLRGYISGDSLPVGDGAAVFQFTTLSNQSIAFMPNGSGSVGIATTNPLYTLQSKTIAAYDDTAVTGASSLLVRAGAGDASGAKLLRGVLNDGITEKWSITRDGAATFSGVISGLSSIIAGLASNIGWTGSTSLNSSTDGIIVLRNNAQTDFLRLQFGGTTASFPSIKRNLAALEAKLADDSAYTQVNLASSQWINAAAQPTCAVGTRGTVWYVAGATTVKDTFNICAKDAADSYAWRTIY